MKNKMINTTIRVTALLTLMIVLTVSFIIYINRGAALGCKVETSLQITSGNPAVLDGFTFNIWSQSKWTNDNLMLSIRTHDSVSFDKTGKPNITSFIQMNGEDYLKIVDENVYLNLAKDLKLYFRHDQIVPGFQVDDSLKSKIEKEKHYSCYIPSITVGENSYFTIKSSNIRSILSSFNNSNYDENSENSKDNCPYYLVSGIFRTDGNKIENILPIDISYDKDYPKIWEISYIPQTKCLALIVQEGISEWCIYIYQLESNAIEKHYLTIPVKPSELYLYVYVNDNILTMQISNLLICIETDKTNKSFMRKYFNSKAYRTYYDGIYSTNCFLPKGSNLFVVSIDNYLKSTFDTLKFNLYVFNESELIFEGYILIYNEVYPRHITISDTIPLYC